MLDIGCVRLADEAGRGLKHRNGSAADTGSVVRLADEAGRGLKRLGLDRMARDLSGSPR